MHLQYLSILVCVVVVVVADYHDFVVDNVKHHELVIFYGV